MEARAGLRISAVQCAVCETLEDLRTLEFEVGTRTKRGGEDGGLGTSEKRHLSSSPMLTHSPVVIIGKMFHNSNLIRDMSLIIK